MSTPGETDEIQPAVDQADQNAPDVPATKPTRTIRAFFGGQGYAPPVSTEVTASSKPENTAKRRRKNTEKEIGPGQGRILLNVPGSTSWSVGRREEDGDTESVGSGAPSTSSGAANGKGRAAPRAKQGGGGEEEEMKEMDRKMKATRGRNNATRGKRGRKGGTVEGGRLQQLDMKADEESEDPLSSPRDSSSFDAEAYLPSPGKNRGRQRKLEVKTNGNESRKTNRSTSTARDQSPDIHIIRSSSPNDVEITGHINGAPKPTALSRIKTTSNSSLKGASHQDPIDLEAAQTSLKPGPKRHVFASDLKPAHSFFSRNNPATSSRATSVTSDKSGPGESRKEEPTTAPSDPSAVPPDLPVTAPATDSAPLQNTKKPVHNFFHSAGAVAKPGILKNGWGQGIKEGEEWSAPWPGSSCSGWQVHEGGPIEPITAGPSMPKRTYTPQPIDNEPTFWHSVLRGASMDSSSTPDSRDKGKQRAPAAFGDRETFAERFRPRQASQVLGNVTESTYLRDWLSALSVGTHESDGPKVIRRVPKARRTVDDWIVDDIGLYGLPEEEGDLDEIPEPLEEADVPIGHRPQWYPPLSNRLTNSILLTGPSGSGKSAAVYAAATELGWEVFEVYPGIGKRTGGNLMSLVGDVGKNHMVGKAKEVEEPPAPAPAPVPPTAGIQSFFKPKGGGDETPVTGSQGEPIEVDDDHPDQSLTPPPSTRPRTSSVNLTPFRDETKFRQSLILIEEVDILFEEESSFWPAVISLIAESRRPVIMTCNGIDNVAVGSLPLQAILHFQPPPRNQAIDYLTSLCSKLGIESENPEAYVADLYDRSVVTSSDLIARPGPPNGNEWLPSFDLRKAIMQLQLERGHPSATETSDADPPERDLNDLARRIDMLSYTDAHLHPRSWAVMEVNELDRYEPNLDDRLGTRTVLKPELPDHIPVLPAYDHTSEISSYLTKELGLGVDRSPADPNLLTYQIHHIRSLLPLLDPVIPLSSHLLPHPCLFIDYMPIIQTLIQIDDIRHAAYAVAKAGGEDVRNFKTGRPMRVTAWLGQDGFSRHLELEPDALEVGRRRLRYWD